MQSELHLHLRYINQWHDKNDRHTHTNEISGEESCVHSVTVKPRVNNDYWVMTVVQSENCNNHIHE